MGPRPVFRDPAPRNPAFRNILFRETVFSDIEPGRQAAPGVRTMGATSLYGVLGVPPTATDEEIRAAYRRAAKRAHPDAGGSQSAFRRVNTAYRVLSDPARRRAYDLRLAQASRPPEWPDMFLRPDPSARPGDPGWTGARHRTSPYPRPAARRWPPGQSGAAVPRPDARARRRYFVAMAICLVLFVLAGAVVRHYSVPAAMVMMAVAMLIPPAAAVAVNRPPRDR